VTVAVEVRWESNNRMGNLWKKCMIEGGWGGYIEGEEERVGGGRLGE
jgi:hypothetical protein